jgi:hypothetical protein
VIDRTTIFDEIRTRCGEVAEKARSVRIVHSAIPESARRLMAVSPETPRLDTDSHYVGDPPQTVAFFLTLAAVNFGSGYFPYLHKRRGMSGYFTLATSLKERFEERGSMTAAELADVTAGKCAKIFGQDAAHPVIGELMQRYAAAWRDLGADLLEQYGGSFTQCIERAEHRAARLVEALSEEPFFRDVQEYQGTEIPFFKRSQLLASDLALALGGSGWGRFDDLDRLTLFADNLVPHVLRLEGILRYDPGLLNAIESEQLIAAGSPEEVEIRACSVHAVELLVQAAADESVRWTARDVDQLLWHRGQEARYKKRGKRHRTRTVFY